MQGDISCFLNWVGRIFVFCPPLCSFKQFSEELLRCEAMSFPEKQAREAWTSKGEEEEEGNEEEKEPAIVDRV